MKKTSLVLIEGQKVGVTLFHLEMKFLKGAVKRLSANVDPKTGRRKLFVKLTTSEDFTSWFIRESRNYKTRNYRYDHYPKKSITRYFGFVVRDGQFYKKCWKLEPKTWNLLKS